MNPLYPEVAERARYRCEYCRAPAKTFNFQYEVEHIVPRSIRGSDDMDNLALSCRACNTFKSTKQSAIDPETNTLHRLFNPRLDRWEDHFSVDENMIVILGKSPIGRATIAALRLNSAQQQQARTEWKRFELFP